MNFSGRAVYFFYLTGSTNSFVSIPCSFRYIFREIIPDFFSFLHITYYYKWIFAAQDTVTYYPSPFECFCHVSDDI